MAVLVGMLEALITGLTGGTEGTAVVDTDTEAAAAAMAVVVVTAVVVAVVTKMAMSAWLLSRAHLHCPSKCVETHCAAAIFGCTIYQAKHARSTLTRQADIQCLLYRGLNHWEHQRAGCPQLSEGSWHTVETDTEDMVLG